jgi:tetratricopeptide (TPR) repeat protein
MTRSLLIVIRRSVLSLAALVAVQAPAFAQAGLSDMLQQKIQGGSLSDVLQQKIIEGQKAESERLFELALGNYGEAMKLSADSPAGIRLILKKRAALFEQIDMAARAEADLSSAINVQPFDPKTLADRGYFYIRQKRTSEALDDFVKGTRVAPTDPMFAYGAGRALTASGDFVNATKFYAEAIKLSPRDGKLYLARAESLVRQKRMPDALSDYNRAFALGIGNKNDRFFGHTGRGYISLMDSDFGAAVQSFNRALEISPGASNVLLWRGYAYERQGKRDLALKDFQDALVSSPDSNEIKTSLDRLRMQMLQTASAPAAPAAPAK